jgi:hypothetical protein
MLRNDSPIQQIPPLDAALIVSISILRSVFITVLPNAPANTPLPKRQYRDGFF